MDGVNVDNVGAIICQSLTFNGYRLVFRAYYLAVVSSSSCTYFLTLHPIEMKLGDHSLFYD